MCINGVLIARRLAWERQGRALPARHTYRCLVGDELLLLSSANPESFDSRYFALLTVDGVVARVQLLSSGSCR
ncbi:S26 family signal peptidase [Ectopseudomonas guguanensis]|uniref:S26 family signal peptidase n=1 Tax=Ectopseudomonas guguanensis TaxID=1198456 RepID=UPI0036F3E644